MEGKGFPCGAEEEDAGCGRGLCFYFYISKTPTYFLGKERGRMVGAGMILGHLAPVKLLLVIRSILRSTFLANT